MAHPIKNTCSYAPLAGKIPDQAKKLAQHTASSRTGAGIGPYFPLICVFIGVSNRLVSSLLLYVCLCVCINRLRPSWPEKAFSSHSFWIDWRHRRKYTIFFDLEYLRTRRRASSHHFLFGNFGKYLTARDSSDLHPSTLATCHRTSCSPCESAATASSPAAREKRIPCLYCSSSSLRSGLRSFLVCVIFFDSLDLLVSREGLTELNPCATLLKYTDLIISISPEPGHCLPKGESAPGSTFANFRLIYLTSWQTRAVNGERKVTAGVMSE